MNIYTHPEHHGLIPFGEIDWKNDEDDYGFDLTVVWTSKNETICWADDTGNADKTPFESHTIRDVTYGPKIALLQHIAKKDEANHKEKNGPLYLSPEPLPQFIESIIHTLPDDPAAERLYKAQKQAQHEREKPPQLRTCTIPVGWTDTLTSDKQRILPRDRIQWNDYPIPVMIRREGTPPSMLGICDEIAIDGTRIDATVHVPDYMIEQLDYGYFVGVIDISAEHVDMNDHNVLMFLDWKPSEIVMMPPEESDWIQHHNTTKGNAP